MAELRTGEIAPPPRDLSRDCYRSLTVVAPGYPGAYFTAPYSLRSINVRASGTILISAGRCPANSPSICT